MSPNISRSFENYLDGGAGPLWVNPGISCARVRCPLSPRKQTSLLTFPIGCLVPKRENTDDLSDQQLRVGARHLGGPTNLLCDLLHMRCD